jgi:chemotaxis protein MotB
VTAIKAFRWSFYGVLAALMLVLAGCGHTDEEMAAKQREIDKLSADLKAAKAQMTEDQARYGEATTQIEGMKEQLKQAGINVEQSKAEGDRLKQALAEYKQRADQLAAIEQRFRDLKSRLDKLTQIGLKVVVRNNRMVIQLPGDILFDSGKDELRAQGKEALMQVAEVIRNDKDLNARNFQVAGHTDDAKYPPGGPFHDNWGLSLARARQVLLFLIAPADAAPFFGADGRRPEPQALGGGRVRRDGPPGGHRRGADEGRDAEEPPRRARRSAERRGDAQPERDQVARLGTCGVHRAGPSLFGATGPAAVL